MTGTGQAGPAATGLGLDKRFAEAMGQLMGPDFPSDIGLAVSGGGDSMAMLTLAHNWTRVWGLRLWVITVDHGLRPESAAEAALVAEECAALGWPHATARWHWDGVGNTQACARDARLALIDRWRGGLQHVLMAHTQDDLAETFLMRIDRGAGVSGLAAMAAARRLVTPDSTGAEIKGDILGTCPPPDATGRPMTVLRPCLTMRRAELRFYLGTLKGRWVEDPTNDDPVYDRVRMRRALPALQEAGLDPSKLAEAAHRLRRAESALVARARDVWDRFGSEDRQFGHILLHRDLSQVEEETALRLLSTALRCVASRPYAPREAALERLWQEAQSGKGGTLHGCLVHVDRDHLRICRELGAVASLSVPARAGVLWDRRWRYDPDPGPDRVHGTDPVPGLDAVPRPGAAPEADLTLRALGEAGWSQLPVRSPDGPAHRTALSLPALWQGERLIACPALDPRTEPRHVVRLHGPEFMQWLDSG